MKILILGAIAVFCLSFFILTSPAQDTNVWSAPPTKLEAFQTNIGTVILKGSSEVGTVSAAAGILTVSYEQLTDVNTDKREYGMVIGIAVPNRQVRNQIDYDEVDSLLKAIDLLNNLDSSVSSLPSLDAFYNSKDGFRIAAFTNKRMASIQIAVRSLRWNVGPVILSRTEAVQLRNLISQAKNKLDTLRASK